MAAPCDDSLLQYIALTFLKEGGADLLRALDALSVSVDEFFSLPDARLSELFGRPVNDRFSLMKRDEALARARTESEFMSRHGIEPIVIGSAGYPWSLIDISDPPVVLYKLGGGDICTEHSLSVVGTRRPTVYGTSLCSSLIPELAASFPDLNIISGLAYGIDAAAHTAALDAGALTTAVVAHGLDTIYPAANRDLARRIVREGGAIISEYPSCTRPFPGRFLERNRIVACIPQGVIVVESDLRGGAMSTANDAFSYSREVMAVPGRISDELSRGCNSLVRRGKAHLVTCAADVIDVLGWQSMMPHADARQHNLFPELDGDQSIVYDALRSETEPDSLDHIHQILGRLAMSRIMAALGELEFEGVVVRHPGNRYAVS